MKNTRLNDLMLELSLWSRVKITKSRDGTTVTYHNAEIVGTDPFFEIKVSSGDKSFTLPCYILDDDSKADYVPVYSADVVALSEISARIINLENEIFLAERATE